MSEQLSTARRLAIAEAMLPDAEQVPSHERHELSMDRRASSRVNLAPQAEEREVPLSAQAHRWDYFHAQEVFGNRTDTIASQDERFAVSLRELEGRRRPVDSMITTREIDSIWTQMTKGKKMPQRALDALRQRTITTFADFLSLTPQDLAIIQAQLKGDGQTLITVMEQYTQQLLVLPHIVAVAKVQDREVTQADVVPQEEEARIVAQIERAVARVARLKERSHLVANIFISWAGLRDGVQKQVSQVAAEYGAVEGTKGTTTKTHIEEAIAILGADPSFSRAVVLPEGSLGRISGAYLLSDLPPESDVQLNIQDPRLRFIFGEAGLTRFDQMAQFIPTSMDAPLAPAERIELVQIFTSALGPDPLGARQRMQQMKAWGRLQRIVREDIVVNNKFLPQLTPQELALVIDLPITELTKNYGLVQPLRLGIPWPQDGRPALDVTSFGRLLDFIGDAERAGLERKITVEQLLPYDTTWMENHLRNYGEAKIKTMKRLVLEYIASLDQEMTADFTDITTIDAYLMRKIDDFMYDPTRQDEDVTMLVEAQRLFAVGQFETVTEMIDRDIVVLERVHHRNERLFQETGAIGERFELLIRRVDALLILQEAATLAYSRQSMPERVQKAIELEDGLIEEMKTQQQSPEFFGVIGPYTLRLQSEANIETLRQVRAQVAA